MFRKKVKKAFTLVELLVVIAILAILATVSVVGYMQFTKRAQQSNDMSLTTQINTVLQADEVTGKPQTMTEAIAVMEEAGANIAELTPTTEGYSYVWNSATNRVILLDGGKKVVAPADATIDNPADCYAIIKSEADLTTWAGYSLYFTREYAGTGYTLPATSSLVSVDVGTSAIKTLNILAGNGTATIYTTEGSTVTINAPGATINHYGAAASVDVQEVANNSYHLYATVSGNVTLTAGRLVAEANSSAAAVIVDVENTAAVENVTVEIKSNSAISAVAATKDGVMGALQEAGNLTGGENTSVETVVVDPENKDFAGGLGTEASPYLIETAAQLLNINDYFPSVSTNLTMYVQLQNNIYLTAEDIAVAKTRDYPSITLYYTGVIDGNGYSIISPDEDCGSAYLVSDTLGDVTIKNLTLVQTKGTQVMLVYCASIHTENQGVVTLENIAVNGATENTVVQYGNNASSFIALAWGEVAFKNCTNNLKVNVVGYAGIFLGGYATEAKVTYDTCINTAQITGEKVGFFNGNVWNDSTTLKLVDNADFSDSVEGFSAAYVVNCENSGSINGCLTATPFATNGSAKWQEADNAALTSSQFEQGNFGVYAKPDYALTVEKTGGTQTVTFTPGTDMGANSYYMVSYYVQMSFKKANGVDAGSSYVMINETISASEINNWSIDFVSYIIGSDEYDADENNTTKYADLPGEVFADDYQGSLYKVVTLDDGSKMIVVSSQSMVELFGNGATTVTLKATKPTYRITAYSAYDQSLSTRLYDDDAKLEAIA